MSKSNQTPDASQKGPGQRAGYTPTAPSAPSPSPASNSKSGTSQSNSRGKQG